MVGWLLSLEIVGRIGGGGAIWKRPISSQHRVGAGDEQHAESKLFQERSYGHVRGVDDSKLLLLL